MKTTDIRKLRERYLKDGEAILKGKKPERHKTVPLHASQASSDSPAEEKRRIAFGDVLTAGMSIWNKIVKKK